MGKGHFGLSGTKIFLGWSTQLKQTLLTWLRSKMTDERLDDLAILAIEKSTYKACTNDELVSSFLTMKKRR
jgi:hypothetical protein